MKPVVLLLALPVLLAATSRAEPAEAPGFERRIEVGDHLRVWVLGHPELGARQTDVAADGTVALPKVRRMPALGLTRRELAKSIEAALDRYVTYRNLIVIVQWIETPP